MLTILIVVVIYFLGFIFSPFPYWKTYRILWLQVLYSRDGSSHNTTKYKQVMFLIKYALLCPLSTFLWHIDEILYPKYQQQKIRPVFIIGQPRSGTTFLHRTLANDDNNFVAVRHIEWRYPYILIQNY